MKRLQFIFLFIVLSLLGCEETTNSLYLDKSKLVEVNCIHLNPVFLSGDANQLHKSLRNYPELYENFYTRMIRAGEKDHLSNPNKIDSFTIPKLQHFLNDSSMKVIFKSIAATFNEFDDYKEKISVGMGNYSDIFNAGITHAQIGTFYSNFNATVLENDHVIWIGLDMYLGNDNDIVKMLPPNTFPNYYKQKMDKKYIISDVFFSFLMTHHFNPMGDELLARMLSYGKITYIMDKILPFESDENKFRYTKDELNWCKENEEYIWRFIIDEKLLYNKEPALIDPFFQEGPYTKSFGPDSPSTIGIWLGYEMIKDYVDYNNVDVVELMKENNIQKLLKYYEP